MYSIGLCYESYQMRDGNVWTCPADPKPPLSLLSCSHSSRSSPRTTDSRADRSADPSLCSPFYACQATAVCAASPGYRCQLRFLRSYGLNFTNNAAANPGRQSEHDQSYDRRAGRRLTADRREWTGALALSLPEPPPDQSGAVLALKGIDRLRRRQLPSPTYYTAPSGIASINGSEDCHASAEAVLPTLLASSASSPSLLSQHSATLIACYSMHPLVPLLLAAQEPPKPVLGIFEASILGSLAVCLRPEDRFGIVTTGAVWDEILTRGVRDYFGNSPEVGSKFAGVETTGLTAIELHETAPEEVTRRLRAAVRRLIRRCRAEEGELRAVCLGCAGMVGFDEAIREGCIEELGEVAGRRVSIVDGVKVGYALLEGMVRTGLA